LLFADVAPAATVGDVAELGDIDVDQRSGMIVFVAAQWFAGDPVDPGEAVDPAAHQDRVHGRGGQAEPAADLDWAQPLAPPQPHDLAHRRGRGAVRAVVRAAAAVGHPGHALGAVAVGPFAGGFGGDHEHLRCFGAGPALFDDQAGQPQPGSWGQGGVRVGHEGLRSVMWFLDSSTSQPEAFACQHDRPSRRQPGTTSLDITASGSPQIRRGQAFWASLTKSGARLLRARIGPPSEPP
jgi:hypothetical protein